MQDNNNNLNDLELIDIEKVLKNSNSKILQRLPRFFVYLLKKILHVDEINAILLKNKDLYGTDFMVQSMKDYNITVLSEGEENIEKDKRYFFAANHALGAIDGFAIFSIVNNHYTDIKALVNDLLRIIKNVRDVILPVNSFGRSSKEYIEYMRTVMDSDDQIIIFPSGTVTRKRRGEIIDKEWQKSLIKNTINHKRTIIPTFVQAENTRLFYFVANARKFLGIKTNIELFLLPHEMLKQKNKTIKIIFGKPLDYTFFDKSKSHTEWAEYVKQVVYNMNPRKNL